MCGVFGFNGEKPDTDLRPFEGAKLQKEGIESFEY
jgi:hypothetical protein